LKNKKEQFKKFNRKILETEAIDTHKIHTQPLIFRLVLVRTLQYNMMG